MKITREQGTLVVHIPTKSEGRPLVVGVIAGDEYTISHLIYLDYKDDYQEGSPIIHFDSKEELIKECKIADIDIWEHSLCAYCGNVIRGAHTIGKKGNMCYTCEFNKD